MYFLARSQNTIFWRGINHPSANEALRIFVNSPSCFVLSCTRGLTGWSWFHFAAVSSILLGLWSMVCSQVSWESVLGMGGFSLKLVEVCQGFQLKKDSRVFVVRKFSGKRMLVFYFPCLKSVQLAIGDFPSLVCLPCTDCVLNNLCWQQSSVAVMIRRSCRINVYSCFFIILTHLRKGK